MCLLDTLYVLPFDKQIFVYSKVQNPSVKVRKYLRKCVSTWASTCVSAQVLAQVKCTSTQDRA